MVRPRRAEQIDLRTAIRETAWRQMARVGTAELTLRGIARELGITAPAIYNHYASRDDLVTELIIEAYTSLGEAQAKACRVFPAGEHALRLRAAGESYRGWALAYPQRYQLIFGTPIPGYHCPLERTLPAAAFSLSTLVGVLEEIRRAGRLRLERPFAISAEKLAWLEAWQKQGTQADLQSFSMALLVWSRVHGLVSLEIGRQIPEFGPNVGELYAFELDRILEQTIR